MSNYNHSGNGSSGSSQTRPHSLGEMFLCKWSELYGLHCGQLIRGHNLSAHLRQYHGIYGSDTLRFECKWEDCSRVVNRESMTRHVEETHMKIVYSCDCGRTFSRTDTLNKHKQSCSSPN